MKVKVYKLLLLSLTILVLSGIYAQITFSTIPWQISYSKYRLWYEVYIPYNTSGAYINFSVPKTILDDVARYCLDHNYTRCDILFPRLYYYNETTEQQVEMDWGLVNVTSWYVYNNSVNYPMNFTLFYPYYLSKGYHYFVIYYPWYFWEDWEELPVKSYSTAVGSCLPNDWCVSTVYEGIAYGDTSISTKRKGWFPTPKRTLVISAYAYGSITIYKEVNVVVNPNYPTYLEFNHSGYGCIGVTVLLKDGTTKTLVYNYGYCNKKEAGFPNVCNTTTVSGTIFMHDILDDFAKYCYVYPQDIVEIKSIYLSIIGPGYGGCSGYWDNIKIIPGDLSKYYP